jgi:KUP system potassium uptake protein
VLHERVLVVSIETAPVPVVPGSEIAAVDELGYRDDGITLITARFGYMQRTDIPGMLAALAPEDFESPVDLEQASYFLSTIDLEPSEHPTMPPWRTRLFLALSSLTADAARAFELPGDRTVVISSRISV